MNWSLIIRVVSVLSALFSHIFSFRTSMRANENYHPGKKWVEITSPMVGTFYCVPTPDELPFVEIGERITKGQTVCIIEAMNLTYQIKGKITGEVMEIAVKNGQSVEYGQTLMWINPSKSVK